MSGPCILCCGDLIADLIAQPDGSFRPTPGGAALNTAVALARLDVPTGICGIVSDDMMGVFLRDHLEQSGVDCRALKQSSRPQAIALAQPIEGTTRFSLYTQGSAQDDFDNTQLPESLPETVEVLVFGGVSLIHSPMADSYETLATRYATSKRIWLDLNIRPSLIRGAATYRARLERMMGLADVIKASDEDLRWLGISAEQLQTRYANALVIETCGSSGAFAAGHHAPAPPAKVIDTVGAGDVFNAGFLYALHKASALPRGREFDLKQALHAGVGAGSFTVSRLGPTGPQIKDMLCVP